MMNWVRFFKTQNAEYFKKREWKINRMHNSRYNSWTSWLSVVIKMISYPCHRPRPSSYWGYRVRKGMGKGQTEL